MALKSNNAIILLLRPDLWQLEQFQQKKGAIVIHWLFIISVISISLIIRKPLK